MPFRLAQNFRGATAAMLETCAHELFPGHLFCPFNKSLSSYLLPSNCSPAFNVKVAKIWNVPYQCSFEISPCFCIGADAGYLVFDSMAATRQPQQNEACGARARPRNPNGRPIARHHPFQAFHIRAASPSC